MTSTPASDDHDVRPRVVVLNGAPCSGKSTLARALQSELEEPWLHVNLDAFPLMLPPFPSGMPSGEPLRRIVTGHNAAVAAIVEAGNNVLLELVARKNNPGASLVLVDLFDRLAKFEVMVVCLHCDKQTAMEREAGRAPDLAGLVERDHANIDEEGCDLIVDSSSMTVEEEVTAVQEVLDAGASGGIDRLRARAHTEAKETDWDSRGNSAGRCRRFLKTDPLALFEC